MTSPPASPCPGSPSSKADGSTASGCWIYAGLLRRRRQPDAAPRPRRPRLPRRLGLARVGVGVAGQPPGALQPRLGRPRGPALVRAQEVRLVGRGAGQVDRLRRAGLPGRQGARLPARARRQGDGRDRRHRPVHHDGRRQGLAVLAGGPARRADADALRAARVARREPALPRGGLQPGGADLEPPGQPGPRRGRHPLPVRRDDLPAHRAPHGGRDEPQPALAGRAAAGDVRRDRPDPGQASAGSRTAAGW